MIQATTFPDTSFDQNNTLVYLLSNSDPVKHLGGCRQSSHIKYWVLDICQRQQEAKKALEAQSNPIQSNESPSLLQEQLNWIFFAAKYLMWRSIEAKQRKKIRVFFVHGLKLNQAFATLMRH